MRHISPGAEGKTTLPPQAAVVRNDLRRDFRLEVPLFSPASAWNQRADAAPVLPESDRQVAELYRLLLGDTTALPRRAAATPSPYPFPFVDFDDGSVPIFRAGAGACELRLRTYAGARGSANPKIAVDLGHTVIPASAGPVRPSGPESVYAGGEIVIVDRAASMEWDLWQASTVVDGASGGCHGAGRVGTTIVAAGSVDRFYLAGSGTNPPAFYSARSAGTPLLGGLLLPEDAERGSIDHALAFAVPALRNTNPANPSEPFADDVVYPAATTETERISTSAFAVAAGQRMRLREIVVGEDAIEIDYAFFAPITRMVLTALRRYGAYAVATAPSLTFFAEDVHTAPLALDAAQMAFLLGRPSSTPLPPPQLYWRALMERLGEDLGIIPFAAGRWWEYGAGRRNPHAARPLVANFEMVAPPRPGLLRRRRAS